MGFRSGRNTTNPLSHSALFLLVGIVFIHGHMERPADQVNDVIGPHSSLPSAQLHRASDHVLSIHTDIPCVTKEPLLPMMS